MKKIDGKTARQIHALTFSLTMPLAVFVGFLVGGYVAMKSESVAPLVLGVIGTPLLWSYLTASKHIRTLNRAYTYMSQAVKSKLRKADYYNSGEYGAIAVDARNKEIAVISADPSFKFTEPFTFESNKIRSYKSHAPGHSEWDSVGKTDMRTRQQMLRKNLRAKSKAHTASGLYIDLDDVFKPQVFVQMEYAEAEKWMLIIEKLLNGTLQEQSTPMLFPQG